MRLVVSTPLSVLIDVNDIRHVRAEDESGAFGILPGHADFVTVLAISVVTWCNRAKEDHGIAVRGGILTVHGGNMVEIASREAIGEDTLAELGPAVLERLRQEEETEREAWVSATRLQVAAIRYVQRYLEAGRGRVGSKPYAGPRTRGGKFLDET